jgi:hypothetical protein
VHDPVSRCGLKPPNIYSPGFTPERSARTLRPATLPEQQQRASPNSVRVSGFALLKPQRVHRLLVTAQLTPRAACCNLRTQLPRQVRQRQCINCSWLTDATCTPASATDETPVSDTHHQAKTSAATSTADASSAGASTSGASPADASPSSASPADTSTSGASPAEATIADAAQDASTSGAKAHQTPAQRRPARCRASRQHIQCSRRQPSRRYRSRRRGARRQQAPAHQMPHSHTAATPSATRQTLQSILNHLPQPALLLPRKSSVETLHITSRSPALTAPAHVDSAASVISYVLNLKSHPSVRPMGYAVPLVEHFC